MAKPTKSALLDCAETATRMRGFDAFSYADLAGAVGIRKASVHHHFPTKADLSHAMMARYLEKMDETLELIQSAQPTGANKIMALIDHYRAALQGGTTICLCVALCASRQSLRQDVIEVINTYRYKVLAWIAKAYTQGRNDGSIPFLHSPSSEAHATLALLEGAHMAARSSQSADPFDEALHILRTRCTTKTQGASLPMKRR